MEVLFQGEVSVPFFSLAVFQVFLVQNNPYVKEAYFVLTYSGFLQATIKCFSEGFDFVHIGPYLVDLLTISIRIQVSGPAYGYHTLGSPIADTDIPCWRHCGFCSKSLQ